MANTRPATRSVELGIIAEINPPPPETSENAEISILEIESVSEETGLIDPSKTKKISKAPGNTVLLQDGDILVAKNSPYFERGKIALISGSRAVSGASPKSFHVIRPKRAFSSRWLWYFLRQRVVREKAEQFFSVKGLRRQLPVDFLNQLVIPLPPDSTQKRIMRLLDEVAATRSLQKESILQIEKIGAALFREMFGDDPDKNSKRWKRGKLSELVKVSPGAIHSSLNRPGTKGEWAVVTSNSVTSGFFKSDEALALLEKDSTQKPISKGDLLMSWMNTSELVGTVALVEEDYNHLFLPETLWKLVPRRSVSTSFLKELLSTPSIHQRIHDLAIGTFPLKITASKLLGLPIIKPPQQLQQQFAKIYWELPELRRSQEALITELDHLHASLLNRVFPRTETTTGIERSGMKKSRRPSRKKTVKRARKRVSASQTSANSHRIIWDKLSSFQRDVWTTAQTFTRPFRAGELAVAVNERSAKPVSRESIMISVELLVSLGVLIKEGRQDADRWRVPNPEIDREIEV